MRGAGLSFRLRVGRVPGTRDAGRRAAPARAPGERPPRPAALLTGDQGRRGARREHPGRRGRAAPRPRPRRGAGKAEPRDLRAGTGDRGGSGDHHRRHEVRVRPPPRRDGPPDRRGPHARLLALLAEGALCAGARPAVTRQATGPGLPRRARRRWRVGQDVARAGTPRRGRRGDDGAIPEHVPPPDRVRPGRLPRPRPCHATVMRRSARAMNPRLQQGVIIVPSALTLGNLFFGIWAIVAATRGEFVMAAWLIVAAGAADMLDGRVARVTQTGSRFGEQLDSLVDAVSFGVAPALIVYH